MITFVQYGILIILSLFLVLHFSVILKFIPYKLVWGGRLKTEKEMYRFEIISIMILVFFLFVVLVHSGFLQIDFSKKITKIILWIMPVLFFFNTLGNAFSKNKVEQRIFTPVTILLTVFSLILAMNS